MKRSKRSRRQIKYTYPSSESSSEYSVEEEEIDEEEEELNDDEFKEVIEFNWKDRNEYVNAQLKIIERLSITQYSSLDVTFRKRLEVKIQNMYRQIEPLLELESPSDVKYKVLSIEDTQYSNPVTITERIRERDEFPEEYDLKSVGIQSSINFRKRYGRGPRKKLRYIRGVPTVVNEYTELQAPHTIDAALDDNQ